MIVNCVAYQDGRRSAAFERLDDLEGWRDRCEGFVWLGLRMPTEAELDQACRLLDLDDVSAAELLKPRTRTMTPTNRVQLMTGT